MAYQSAQSGVLDSFIKTRKPCSYPQVIALAALFVFRTFFLLISSKDAGIENIFIWPYQLIFSAAFLLFYWLYSKKTYLSKYISILRLISYLSSFCFGICVGNGTPMLLSLTIFSLDGLGGIRNPHQIAAEYFVLSLIPVVYFVLLYGIRRIQPVTFNVKNKLICAVLVVLGCLAFWPF